jgi:hypothetical protein
MVTYLTIHCITVQHNDPFPPDEDFFPYPCWLRARLPLSLLTRIRSSLTESTWVRLPCANPGLVSLLHQSRTHWLGLAALVHARMCYVMCHPDHSHLTPLRIEHYPTYATCHTPTRTGGFAHAMCQRCAQLARSSHFAPLGWTIYRRTAKTSPNNNIVPLQPKRSEHQDYQLVEAFRASIGGAFARPCPPPC